MHVILENIGYASDIMLLVETVWVKCTNIGSSKIKE